MEPIHKFFQLPPSERLILAQAWGLFILVELALRILPFMRLLNLSKKVFQKQKGEPAWDWPSVVRMSWLVEVAGRYAPVKVTCLKKALVLSWLFGRRGTQAELQIGVARQQGGLKAHAWLDLDGQVIIGHQELERYETLLGAKEGPTSQMR